MSRKSVSPKIGSPLGPVGSFFTSPKFLGSDRLGTQIAEVDRIANEAYQSVGLGCPGYEQQYTALLNLDKAAKLYAEMIEQMVRDQVEKDSDIFQKAQNSLTDVIYYRSVLNSELTDCLARHVYPEIGHVADGKNGNDTADDTYIRAKIRRSKLVQPCGFETFQDIAGGAAYEKYFEDYAIAPFELKNYNAEVTGTLGTMMYGPPGTGKTLFVKAVASKVASMGVAVYAINAAVIKGKV
jgi:SpoVK/Ycf46/Vps4 family AAA+-type ATPase